VDITSLGNLLKEGEGVDFVMAFRALQSGDLFQILRYDVEPALKIAAQVDPPLAPVMIIATIAIEALIAAKKLGLLDELFSNMPKLELTGADPQHPSMLRATGPENPQI
jgi:hypothetical protein